MTSELYDNAGNGVNGTYQASVPTKEKRKKRSSKDKSRKSSRSSRNEVDWKQIDPWALEQQANMESIANG